MDFDEEIKRTEEAIASKKKEMETLRVQARGAEKDEARTLYVRALDCERDIQRNMGRLEVLRELDAGSGVTLRDVVESSPQYERKSQRWTDEEEQHLIDNYDGSNADEMAAHLRRTSMAVMTKAYELGVGKARIPRWTDEEENTVIALHQQGMNDEGIAKKIGGRSSTSIRTKRCMLRKEGRIE